MVIYKVPESCPVCGNDIKGNKFMGYLCKHCQIIFSERNVKGKHKELIDD